MEVGQLPDEVLRQTVALTFGSVLDALSFGVVNRQTSNALKALGARLDEKADLGTLMTDRTAKYFFRWAELPLRGPDAVAADWDAATADGLIYQCSRCRNPILSPADIISSNYHGARGPALLVENLHNTRIVRSPYSTDFVTGAYSVCDVVCGRCSLPLAKKYLDASEPLNRFKVGKYLLERTLIYAPRCCSHHATRAGLSKKSSDDSEVCARCSQQLEWCTTQAVIQITECFKPSLCRRLAEALREEVALLPLLSRSSLADCSEVMVESGLSWKLSQLCAAPVTDVRTMIDFVDQVSSSLATVGNHHTQQSSAGTCAADLLRAAALSSCPDVSTACAFLSALSEKGRPRPELERLVAALATKLKLDAKRTLRLQKAAELHSSMAFCFWNPFSLCAVVG